jgi:uncharacterized protein (TIGR04255 family)
MSKKMSNAPVYYALAQVQFNPVAAMAKYVDDIQDILRRKDSRFLSPKKLSNFSLFPCMAKLQPNQQ